MTRSSSDTDWLALRAADRAGAAALVEDDGNVVSYGELSTLADDAAGRLRDNGIGPGDATLVGVGLVDSQLVALLWGTWRLGATPLVVDQDSPTVAEWGATLRRLWTTDAESTSLHTVILTSGSGGGPRPVRLTHENIAASVQASRARLGNTSDDRWLLTLPLFHIGGLAVLWRSAEAGGTVVVHNRFDAARVSDAIKTQRVTMASMVPTMLYRLLAADAGPYTGMRTLLLGGAAASRELVERGLESGLPVLQTYGMTEACSQVATVVPGEAVDSLGTTGRPLDGVNIETGEAGVGEIVVSGPTVSLGYLGEPDRVGGHRTGDIGYVDDAGRLVVLSRADDMIVTGGENVYPSRVADMLSRHVSVGQAEVVGIPDPEWGQTLVGIVVGDERQRSLLERWMQERLPRHEVPKRWAFVGSLPLQAGGKVDRAALHEIARSAR